MNIVIVGMGYVGLSLACLLSRHNSVKAVDIVPEKIKLINARICPFKDEQIKTFFKEQSLDLIATLPDDNVYRNADLVIISTPTNYDEKQNYFDTSSVDSTIESIVKVNPNVVIVIKSTVPIGYTKKIIQKYKNYNIMFSPEFLREGKALEDNLYPSRIIVGMERIDESIISKSEKFALLLKKEALIENVPILFTNTTEAEAIKLFSNAYLALRVAYFNEVDTYAETTGLNSSKIIQGIGFDPRIGNYYNNPSFGYGGYCLPKDTKQLLANYENIPENIITAIVDSNQTRKDYIVNRVIEKLKKHNEINKKKVIGIYRLTMKFDSDNFRQSSVVDIMKGLKDNNIEIIVYETILKNEKYFQNCKIVNDINIFKHSCNLILANRFDDELNDVKEIVYTRDLFFRD